MLTAAVLIAVFSGPAMAKVSGRCDNCHTMHNSQNGSSMVYEHYNPGNFSYLDQPQETLLVTSCVGCHSHQTAVTYDLGGCEVPVVYNRNSINFDDCLAGGNFYWVAHATENPDAKGHNVLGIADQDGSLSDAPGRDTGSSHCSNSCHKSLAEPIGTQHNDPDKYGTYTESGCTGCHLRPAHHADDSNVVVGSENDDDDGFYRFLSGHKSGSNYGVCGIEDSDWQASKGAGDHNEYLGNEGNLSAPAKMKSLGNTMTGFCCGCHGNFHAQNTESDGSGSWIRHPSDAKIPITGEYAAYVTYNPLSPVARPDLTNWPGPSSSVNEGGTESKDMVMCLSCHVPHGSPNDDLLRWDYLGECEAGGPATNCGCMQCHTQKGT